jgi:hypothetical protein
MNTTPFALEAELRRSFGTRHLSERPRFAKPGVTLPDHPLPPTRAARLPRSRGVFLAASAHSRLGHWLINALCVALAAVSIIAGAEFAEPVLDGKFMSGNAGPALVASAMRAPVFPLTARPH